MTIYSRPIPEPSDVRGDLAADLEELRALKRMQMDIFQQLRVQQYEEEMERRDEDVDALLGLTQRLVVLTRGLRAERDALQAKLDDQERGFDLRRLAEGLHRVAEQQDHAEHAQAYDDAYARHEPRRPDYHAEPRRPDTRHDRRAVTGSAHWRRTDYGASSHDRMAWALRS